jgi:hypothetical protein
MVRGLRTVLLSTELEDRSKRSCLERSAPPTSSEAILETVSFYFSKLGSNGYFPYFLTALAIAHTFSVLQ